MFAVQSMPAVLSPVSISTDHAKLDVPWVCAAMRALPGGEKLVDGQVRKALHGSLVLGAYLGALQVGVVRVVTDGSIFSSVTDVYVDAAHRNQGIGSALMNAVVEHEAVTGTRCLLQAKSTHWLFYYKWDFHVADRKNGIMVRVGR